MKDLKFRTYSYDDYQFIHDLHRQNMISYINKYWGGWNSDIFRKDIRPESTWIMEFEKQSVGFFIIHFYGKAVLANIQITPEFQNNGIGKETILHCEKACKKRGFKELFLQVFLDNPAINLYEKLGFKTYETNKTHHLMKKRLDN